MFEVGKVYNRRKDIHGLYKGQQYGGIATPAAHPYVFIFTGDAGGEYGYTDGYDKEGVFNYTGEGQTGDMKMNKGNLAIRDHHKNGKKIYLFEKVSSGYSFLGICNYIDNRIEKLKDRNSELRDAIVFRLDVNNIVEEKASIANLVEEPKAPYKTKTTKKDSLSELRKTILSSPQDNASVETKLASVRNRSHAIRSYARKRADGVCEGCNELAPFETKSGPYLEVHHLTRLADKGPDIPKNVIALCPTCHRKAHYSLNYLEFNRKLIDKVTDIELLLSQ